MKEFFDRCYYGALDRIQGLPYACAISAGSDGAGAARQTERICTGWRLRGGAGPDREPGRADAGADRRPQDRAGG